MKPFNPNPPATIDARQFLAQHPTLVAASLVAVLAILQLLAISHGNIQVLRALLAHSDVSTVALVAGVSIVRLAAAEIVPMVIGVWAAELPRPRSVPWFAVLAAGVTGVLLIQLDLAQVSLAFFAVGLVLGLIFRRLGRGSAEADEAGPFPLLALLAFAIPLGMLLFAIRDRPFVPAERLTDRDGGTIAGYVLGTSGDSLVILGEEPRDIYIRKEAEIASRQPCQFDPVDSRTIVHLLFGLSASLHVDCDDPRSEKRSWPATEPSGSPR